MIYLKTLGRLSLHKDGPLGATLLTDSKSLAVVAYLATRSHGHTTHDHVAEFLWPHRDRKKSRNSLRQALHTLRTDGEFEVVSEGQKLSLDPLRIRIDLWEFDQAISQKEYLTAIGLYDGPFLSSLSRPASGEFSSWIESTSDRLWAGLEVALGSAILEARSLGDHEDEVKLARRYCGINPLSERATRFLVQALRNQGDDASALQVFDGYRSLIREELGDTPGQELEQGVVELRETLLAVPDWKPPPVSPGSQDPRTPPAKRKMMPSLALLAGLLAASVLFRPDQPPPHSTGEATLLLQLQGVDGERFWASATVINGLLEVSGRIPLRVNAVLAPARGLVATPVESASGVDIEIRSFESGELRDLIHGAGDDQPIAWAPDGARLLYSEGTAQPGALGYERQPRIYDLDAQRHTDFGDQISESLTDAAWSPLGTQVAMSHKTRLDSGLVIFDASGSEDWSLGDISTTSPVWSPDGANLAFVAWQNGVGEVQVIGANGSGLRPLSPSRSTQQAPVWVSDSEIVFLSDRTGSVQVWATDLTNGFATPLSDDLVISDMVQNPRETTPAWIESVSIVPGAALVSPGQEIVQVVEITDARGEHVAPGLFNVSWFVSNPGVIESDSAGSLRVVDTGESEVRASVNGWREARLNLRSVPLIQNQLTPILEDDWVQGLLRDRWLGFGEPLPFTRPVGGPDGGGVFVNNGDGSYKSGLATHVEFPLSAGLTVEVWGQMPLSGRHYEDFAIGLYDDLPPPDSAATWNTPPLIYLNLGGWRRVAQIIVGHQHFTVPFPEAPGDWHRYAVQLGASGTIRFIVDGKLRWEAPARFPELLELAAHAVVAGRSLDTEIQHGPIRVYEGEKYVLGAPEGR